MNSGGGGGDDGVDYQRQQEEARQARIREGMARINELFNGKQTTTYAPTGPAMNPNERGISNGTYYDAAGKNYDLANGNAGNLRWAGTRAPGVQGPGGRVQTNANGQWSDLPTELYGAANSTTTTEGGFGDDFFNKRAQAYQDYAMPQVEDQYKDQQKALTYALARGGNLGSSLASNKTAELDKDYGLQRQGVIDQGQNYVNQGKTEMATQKANAISLLQASADPDAAYNVAQTSANQLSQMPAFSPLEPVVKNVAAGLGTYLVNNADAAAIAKAKAGGNYSLPASWKGSGTTGGY
jgi:hypothetical protein